MTRYANANKDAICHYAKEKQDYSIYEIFSQKHVCLGSAMLTPCSATRKCMKKTAFGLNL